MQTAERAAQIGDNSASYGQMIAEDPNVIFRDEKALPGLIKEIEAEVEAHEPDLSTDKGRKAIASLAAGIARRKTAIDAAGKERNEALRAKINIVDAVRREVRTKLDDLRDRARAPLTAWEEAEKARQEKIDNMLERLKAAAVVSVIATVEEVDRALEWVRSVEIAPATFGDFTIIAKRAQENALTALAEARARIVKAEEERAELERLRAEREAQERAAREAEEKARAEAAERERIAQAERRAAEEAVAAERRKAQQEREAAEAEARRKHEAEIARANREREEAQRERDRLEAERAREAAEKARLEAEEAARARSRKLIAEARGAAKEAIIRAGGITDEQAVKIVLAIHKGEVPGVSLKV